MTYLKNLLSGIAIGAANIIPGVSGGTMAVILGIYDKLISVISLKVENIKKNWKFIITVGIGMVLGISLLAKLLTYLFEHYNVPTQFFFIGLILGSIPLVWNKATEKAKFRTINIIPFLITFGIMLAMAFLNVSENTIRTTVDVKYFFVLIACGAISAFAMLVPGISGSFILKAMGQYDTVAKAASMGEFNFAVLIPVGIGIIIGFLLGAKLIATLLKKWQQGIYIGILGLVVGSVATIYPREFRFNLQGFVAIIVAIIGFAIPILMGRIKVDTKADKQIAD